MVNHAVKSHKATNVAIAFCLFVLLFACYMLAYSGQLHTIDETSMFAVTESMVKWGRLDTNQIAWSQWALSPATAQGSFGLGGNVFSKKGLAISLLAVPLYWIGLNLSGVGLVQTTMLLNPIVTALTGVIVFLFLRQLGYSSRVCLWVALLFGLSTVAVVYTKVFSSEPVSALALLLAVYFASRCYGERILINSSLAGLSLGLAVVTTAANLVTAPFLLLYLSQCTMHDTRYTFRASRFMHHVSRITNSLRKHWRERWKHLVFFLASLAIVCLLVGFYNYARFGNPLDSGRRFAKGEAFSTPLWVGLYGLLFSPYKSIFLYSPILLACLVSFPLFFKRHRREGWLIGLIVIAHLVLFATWYMWWGGFAWGPRFLVPLTPFLAVTLAPLVEAVLTRGSLPAKLALAALALLSTAVQILGVSVNFVLYEIKLREMFPAPEVNPALYDPPALYDLRYSPILGQLQLLSREYSDLAWLGPDRIDWPVLVSTLGLTLLSAVAIFQLMRKTNKALIPIYDSGRPATHATKVATTNLIAIIGLISVTALSGFSLRRYYRDPLQGGPNAGYMQALQHIEAHAQPGDGLITITPYQYDFPMNHYRGRLPILGLAQAEPPLEEGMVTLLKRILSAHRRLWLVTAGIQPANPTNGVEEWLAQHAFKASDEWYGDFRLCLYGSPGGMPEPFPLDIQLGPDISLRGYQIVSQSVSPGQILSLSLHWQALAQPDRNYKVFVQLLNPEGQLVAQRDSQPLDGFRPTSTWRPGQEITDRYGLLIPATLPPGAYPLVIGMYDVETGQRLQVSGGGTQTGADRILLAEIKVNSSADGL
jgi:hypothetical protein